jgi:hypothetical protein
MMKPVDFARVGIEGGAHFTDELPAMMAILGNPLVESSLGNLRENFGTTATMLASRLATEKPCIAPVYYTVVVDRDWDYCIRSPLRTWRDVLRAQLIEILAVL